MHSQEGRFARCRVCGDYAATGGDAVDRMRCKKHAGRNPCAIEGCSRSTEAKHGLHGGDGWFCGEHWRIVCPPHSAVRRTYNRFWRIGKKHGWDETLHRRFWRFWDALVRRGRAQFEDTGSIDIAEIHRMFGWDDPEN